MTTILEVALAPHLTTDPVAALLPAQPGEVLFGVAKRVHDSACAADQNLGHLEEELLRSGHEVFRQILEKAAQPKADAAPPLCPHCQNKLSRLSGGHFTTIQTRFGLMRVQRVRGCCRRCRKWRFAADALLGLPEAGMESTCRQYQCRFKRPEQFWSQMGDEALLWLETFRRNERWHLLFPHSANPSKNCAR